MPNNYYHNMSLNKSTLNQISRAQNSYENAIKNLDIIKNKNIFTPDLNKKLETINRTTKLVQTISEKANVNMKLEDDYITNLSEQTEEYLNKIHFVQNILNNINWNLIIAQYNLLIDYDSRLREYFLDNEKQYEFSMEIEKELVNYSSEIQTIFHPELINKLIISERLWILSRLTKKEYVELSEIELEENMMSSSIYNKYLENPETIKELIDKWNLKPERRIIVEQIYDNYKRKNYETVIILLTTQIEGIFRDNMDSCLFNKKESNIKDSDMRKKLQKLMEDLSLNSTNEWDKFIRKCNAIFLSYIVHPLYYKVDFKKDVKDINRHSISHTGIVNLEKQKEMNQIIAIRFFLMVDNILYMFEDLRNEKIIN